MVEDKSAQCKAVQSSMDEVMARFLAKA